MAMPKEPMGFVIERYISKNWKYLLWGIIIAMILGSYALFRVSDEMAEMRRAVQSNITSVVMTTADGRAIKVEKSPIEAKFLEKHVAYILANSLVVDKATLTDNFRIDHFKDWKDLLSHSQKLKEFLLHYVDRNDKQAIGRFIAYTKWLISAIAQDKLPEYISMQKYSVKKFAFDKNKFDIVIDIKVATMNFDISTNTYIKKQGDIIIEAGGDFDLRRSSDVNPYGLRFKTLHIQPVQK